METWEDYRHAKLLLLAQMIGSLRAIGDDSVFACFSEPDAKQLENFRRIAAEYIAAYDELTWPAATPAAIAGMAGAK